MQIHLSLLVACPISSSHIKSIILVHQFNDVSRKWRDGTPVTSAIAQFSVHQEYRSRSSFIKNQYSPHSGAKSWVLSLDCLEEVGMRAP
jgi:hypothetical protein